MASDRALAFGGEEMEVKRWACNQHCHRQVAALSRLQIQREKIRIPLFGYIGLSFIWDRVFWAATVDLFNLSTIYVKIYSLFVLTARLKKMFYPFLYSIHSKQVVCQI